MRNILIAGRGMVAQALCKQLTELGHNVRLFGSNESSQYQKLLSESDIVFVAIATKDAGEAALRYIVEASEFGKPVITCEKAALANHWELLHTLPYFRYTASVGGGSRLLDLARSPLLGDANIEGVVNATLNFIFHAIHQGHSPEKALAGAVRLGLCEPGTSDLLGTINAEIQDALLKTAIVANTSGLMDVPVRATLFSYALVSDGGLAYLLSRAQTNRFLIRISRRKVKLPEFGFSLQAGEWGVTGAFEPFAETGFCEWFPHWHNNALRVCDQFSGPAVLFGIGAGAVPTASVMVMDAREFGV